MELIRPLNQDELQKLEALLMRYKNIDISQAKGTLWTTIKSESQAYRFRILNTRPSYFDYQFILDIGFNILYTIEPCFEIEWELEFGSLPEKFITNICSKRKLLNLTTNNCLLQ